MSRARTKTIKKRGEIIFGYKDTTFFANMQEFEVKKTTF